MSTVPSPAELWWRIGWLAGTAVPPPSEPGPEYGVKEVTTWGGRVVARRSLLRESIRVELDRQAQRVYVAAQQEVDRQIGVVRRPKARRRRCRMPAEVRPLVGDYCGCGWPGGCT